MKKYRLLKEHLKSERGVVAILVGIGMVLLLSLVALAIDVAYTWVTRNELQNISDAAAMAAVGELGNQIKNTSPPYDYGAIRGAADSIASLNHAAGTSITVPPGDVHIGFWNMDTKSLDESSTNPNAVRVFARKETGTNGALTLFFASIMGQPEKQVSTQSTAALTGPCGGPVPPFGISKSWFPEDPGDPARCNTVIKFYPTEPDSCVGWNTYKTSPSSASTLNKILTDLVNWASCPTWPDCPTTGKPLFNANAGDSFDYTNGTLTGGGNPNNYELFAQLFEAMKVKNDGKYDLDDNSNWWTTLAPVYDTSECNPNSVIVTAGFAEVRITEVSLTPPREIIVNVICNIVDDQGGCGAFGVLTNHPKLVQ